MSELATQYEQQNQPSTLAQASSSREMEEVKGQIFMAKQFPRNVYQAEQRILDNCKRPNLAGQAVYSYPRGGQKVEGPSIRLAEVIAQNWGNLSFGIKELEQKEGESVAMAYAWDLETNVRQEKVFTVKHTRKAGQQLKKLTDPRDIYEMVANNGARRVRACILGVIPGDIIDNAVEECNRTLSGNNSKPLKDRIAEALKAFKEKYKVTQEQIEERFGYNVSAFTERDVLDLIKIFNSLKDGMSKPEDWFSKEVKKEGKSDLSQSFNQQQKDKPKTDKKQSQQANNKQKNTSTNVQEKMDDITQYVTDSMEKSGDDNESNSK
ncbi:hypothetical protein Pryu01_03144 [Paraliobacillus ryukyuensis]|uniref:RecT family protein n=1 Tax=Paraliobacillus ryukyuensis TaxID=200904 RepID=A0A366DLM4_9BACI|nr:hypothetical protein [Paraliobacillus ryukyuensis]RBO90980.1 hypothetical protein DES48_1282 [Paraliobacillus ryukyuensis]